MTIKKQLQELEERKTELFFKEIGPKKVKKGDLSIRDESGFKPIYLREISFDVASERIKSQILISVISRDSKLGKMYLESKKQNEIE